MESTMTRIETLARPVVRGMVRRGCALLLCALLQPAAAQESEPAAPADTPAVAATPAAAAAEDANFDAAAKLVEVLHGSLLDVMQRSAELGYSGRYAVLEPIIGGGFDTPLIVKTILSNHWGKLDAQQQADFVQLFRQLSIATYASRFNDYDGEAFAEISRGPLPNGRLLIKTELRRPDDKPVRLDYLMHRADDGQWRIISVIANGVNDLSLKRAEYASVIKERGFDQLVLDIRSKIKDMESNGSTAAAL